PRLSAHRNCSAFNRIPTSLPRYDHPFARATRRAGTTTTSQGVSHTMRIPTALAATAGAALALSLAACESTSTRSASYAIVDAQRVETPNIKMGDRATINRIINEGRDNSQVMDILHAYTVE